VTIAERFIAGTHGPRNRSQVPKGHPKSENGDALFQSSFWGSLVVCWCDDTGDKSPAYCQESLRDTTKRAKVSAYGGLVGFQGTREPREVGTLPFAIAIKLGFTQAVSSGFAAVKALLVSGRWIQSRASSRADWIVQTFQRCHPWPVG
jgi:hypothetical protein